MVAHTVVGVDVSKDTLACTVSDDQTRKPLRRGSFANTREGVDALLAWAPAEAPLVLEPTGRYSLLAVHVATASGRTALLAPPREAKYFNKSVNLRAKTDPIDGFGLALFGLSRKLRAYPVMSEGQEHLKQLLSARRLISQCSTRMRQQKGALAHASPVLTATVGDLTRRLNELDRQIRRLTSESPELSVARDLQRIHGVGPVSAAALALCLVSRAFDHPDQFVAFVGLDVRIIQSGKRAGNQGLTKHGDAELRRLLYLSAMASIRSTGSPFLAQYERELAKKLPRTAALCAVARKVARVCWAIHARGVRYDPDRVYRQPEPAGATSQACTDALQVGDLTEASRDASEA